MQQLVQLETATSKQDRMLQSYKLKIILFCHRVLKTLSLTV